MTVNVTKPQINLREKLSEVDKPSGIAGEAILRSETPQEVFNYINAGRRNLIINGDFQVSQRGDYTSATSVTNATYYLDRWRGSIAGCSATIQDTGRKQKMVCTSGGTGTMRTFQIVEPQTINKFLGQKVTLSAKITSNSSNCRLLSYMDGWQTESAVHSGGGTEETLSVTFTVPSSPISVEASYIIGIDGEQSANVTVNTNDYFEVTEVQLEVGTVATPFEHRSYGEELALCQRYYWKSYSQGVAPGAATFDGANIHITATTSSSICPHNFNLPVEMRSAPTVYAYSSNGTIDHGTTSGNLTSAGTDQNQFTELSSTGRVMIAHLTNEGASHQDGYYAIQHCVCEAEL